MTETFAPPRLSAVPVLLTERLMLRAPEPGDGAAFVAYATSERTRFVGGAKPAYAAYEKFCSLIGHWVARGFGRFVLAPREGGAGFGHVGPLQLDDSRTPDITWTLWSAEAEGKGLAFEAAKAVLSWLPGATGLRRLRTEIHVENHASQRIAARLGGVPTTEPGLLDNAVVWRFELPEGRA